MRGMDFQDLFPLLVALAVVALLLVLVGVVLKPVPTPSIGGLT